MPTEPAVLSGVDPVLDPAVDPAVAALGRDVKLLVLDVDWVLTDGGGTFLQYGAINVNHSSTGAHAQGVFTYTAVQSTAGNEIDICPNATVWNPALIGGVTGPTFTDSFGNTFNTLVVEINL